MKFPKYMNGQQVSAYTDKDEIFEGYIKIKDGKRYIVDSNGSAKLLAEMKKVKRVGKLLKEEAEQEWQDELNKFSDYYKNTFDSEKVDKAPDNVKDKIIDEYENTVDNNNIKQNSEEFKKDALSVINQKAAEEKIENGSSTVDAEIEKLKKDHQEESLFNNKDIQKAILKEIEVRPTDASSFVQPEENFGLSKENRDDAIDICMQMIINGESKDQIIDLLQDEYEIAKNEAEAMYDDLSQDDLTWTEEELKEKPTHVGVEDEYSLYESISSEVDNDFEKKLENCINEIDCHPDSILNMLSEEFGGDPKKALKEAGNIYDAVLNLAEQVKMIKVNEERAKRRNARRSK